MSERNAIKDRPCKRCGETVRGKAHKLKEHARGHVSVEREAAAQALLRKLHEDMLKADVLPIPSPTELPLATEEVEAVVDPELFKPVDRYAEAPLYRMADEEVLNAEGD